MVTGAAWTDMDGDGWQDLVLAGEWMPVTIFKNDKGRLRNATKEWGLDQTTGLWNCLAIADIDQDGKMDILAGNLGLNSKLTATPAKPLCMYLIDYNHNGMIKQLLACARDSAYYTFLGKEELERQLPGLRKRFLHYASMAGQSIEQIWPELADHAQILKANMLASMLFLNKGQKGFLGQQLPFDHQLAPIFCFLTGDYNHDGRTDLLAGGNFFGVNPYEGRYDAMAISLSTGQGQGRLNAPGNTWNLPPGKAWTLPPDNTSTQPRNTWTLPPVKGEVRDLQHIRLAANKNAILIARNNDSILVWQYK